MKADQLFINQSLTFCSSFLFRLPTTGAFVSTGAAKNGSEMSNEWDRTCDRKKVVSVNLGQSFFSGVGLDESRCLRLLTTTKNKSWNQLRHCDVIWEASKRRLKFSVWLNRSRFWIICEQKNQLIQNLTGKTKSKTHLKAVSDLIAIISCLSPFGLWW